MIELKHKDKEIEILLQLKTPIGENPKIYIEGEGDFLHHLVEGLFNILDKLARMESIGHSSKQWRGSQ